jgi:oxygen-independent coproporphyrinogen III oxidase
VPLGIYISVPFCRTKCSFCNFASGVFSRERFDRYLDHVTRDISDADQIAPNASVDRDVDTIYLGGGTPSVLAPDQLQRLFDAVRQNFNITADAEITVECAPGTLTAPIIHTLLACGVNRVSLGAQSFVDQETRAVGRLHTRDITLGDIDRLRNAGITNISVDLIAGLPHQTAESWRYSLDEVIGTEVPHVSVYMLEVDEDSRLGRELIAGGTRYHAHFVPNDDATADFYQQACDTLNAAAIQQYEISNFARAGQQSKHNLKYWLRQPYLGFGVDAHSMLLTTGHEALRFSTPDDLDHLLSGTARDFRPIDVASAEDEAFFLGLRLNGGIDLAKISAEFGAEAITRRASILQELRETGLVAQQASTLRLTDRGRLLSNEVFERLMLADPSDDVDGPSSSQSGRRGSIVANPPQLVTLDPHNS